jgi:RNA polymerase-binding transcription factor DksA
MTPAQLEAYRQKLLSLGQRLKSDFSRLSDEALRNTGGATTGNLSNTPVHLADLGSDAFEQEIALSLLENQEQQLEEVAAALRRLEQGTFGLCEQCHRPIDPDRLQAIPQASCCIGCARQAENGE